MGRFLQRRLILSLPTILGIAVLVFIVLLVLPGNPAEIIQGEMANPEVTEALIERWGLDEPPWVRFGRWIWNVAQGDLGKSLINGIPVMDMLLPRLGYSVYLGLAGLLLGSLVGISVGIFSALRPNTGIDYAITTFSFLGLSLPVFVIGLLLQFSFGYRLDILPISGASDNILTPEGLRFLVLPMLALASSRAAVFARMVRTTMLDIIHQDYIRTGRGKGLSETVVVLRHAVPNMLIPIVTLLGVYMKSTIAGLVLIEVVFAWPGIGRLFYLAVQQRDYPVIQGVALMIGIGMYVVNLIVDFLYGIVDPRVRLEGEM
jgi:peptide/nickel transport system permease protein